MPIPASFADILQRRALQQPGELAYIFLADGERDEIQFTYKELDIYARAIAGRLQTLVAKGDRALLLYPPGLEYIKAFFGCLYAGIIAVPAYPPRFNKPDARLQAIVADAQVSIALTTTQILSKAKRRMVHTAELTNLDWLATDENDSSHTYHYQDLTITPDELAFLQYTSGSTSAPKGVMLSHDNLLHNSALIHEAFAHTAESLGMIWLPPYHDMGLIGGILQPIYGGFPVVLMSPVSFLQRPIRWLQAISRYQAMISGGPNFAYDLCVNKTTIEERAGLDLSSWEVAFNGAEPIQPDTLERFTTTFAPYGFRHEAFYPCYGLAEATLIVSGGLKSASPVLHSVESRALEEDRVVPVSPKVKEAHTLVGCGQTLANQRIVIADPQSLTQCSPGQVGEIWVLGDSVAQGYWNKPEETIHTFQACLADTGEGPFLRTGDLGFLSGSELFITGRLKDLIVIRGRNYYPQDIEYTVTRSHPALQPGSGAAFSVEIAGKEQLVIVQELKRTRRKASKDEVAQAVRQAVSKEHGLQVYAVVLLKPMSIPKTSSGKIRRHACRAGFLEETLQVIGFSVLDNVPSSNEPVNLSEEASFIHKALISVKEPAARHRLVELYLQEEVARVLQVSSSQVGPNQPLNTVGFDSLTAVELQHHLEIHLGVNLSLNDFLGEQTLAELAEYILAKREERRAQPTVEQRPLPETTNTYSLSHGQRALWFLHQAVPQNAAYNIAVAAHLPAEVNLQALQRAFQRLVEWHPVLRTTFATKNDEPIQQIQTPNSLFFYEEDATLWEKPYLDEWLSEEAHRPFDLEKGPLMRVYLVRRSGQSPILLLVMHHIIVDFWSVALLIQDIGKLYRAERAGTALTSSPSRFQYRDYVQWQADLLASEKGEQLWTYWHKQLAGDLPRLRLPTDYPRPPLQTYRGAAETVKLSAELAGSLEKMCRAHNVTLYTLLLAAFKVLLYRHTGQSDILVGSPSAGRNRAKFAEVIGYFVNPLVLRTQCAGNMDFITFLDQVRQTVLGALAHHDYPFILLVERLQPDRDFSRPPLFQVMFNWQQTPSPDIREMVAITLNNEPTYLELGEISLKSIPIEPRTAQFDLTLTISKLAGEIGASIQYNVDLFKATTIQRMLAHFQTLLAGIVANPTQSLARLPLLTGWEKQKILEWSKTQTVPLQHMLIQQQFEEQTRCTPEAVAIVYQDQLLTYGALNARANQLSHYLQAQGVGPDTLVGIYLDRSPEMVIALLAILKAGGAYVPLEPAYPLERLVYILEETQAPLLLTRQKLREKIPKDTIDMIYVDTDWEKISREDVQNPVCQTHPQNLAYIIYTSGSTGRPKGVAITHQNTTSLLKWASSHFPAESLQCVLASTSICFDLSVFELFLPLWKGGKLLLAENILQLPQLSDYDVTLVNTVPSAMINLLNMGELPASVQVVNLAGEPLPDSLIRQIYSQKSVQSIHNLYGPSEDTTYSTYFPVERHAKATISIGRPIANTQVFLLDQCLQPVPIGVTGEVYLGGQGLARGYFDYPTLTAEVFLPNPFSKMAGSRMYKTGDLACYREDGNIEFLGRIDRQVKVRGFRIELGEIETILAQHPALQTAVVVAKGVADSRHLVAYIVPHRNQPYKNDDVLAFLRKKLPAYMIPHVFITLDALPLTPNGKLDLAALLSLDTGRSVEETDFTPPRTPLEKRLAAIWAQVLGLEKVGVEDSFFALGGHSLLATKLVGRIRNELQVDLPVQRLFEIPTVASLANYIEAVQHWGKRDNKSILTMAEDERDEGKL